MRILMVEDEKYIAKAIAEVLKKNHYTVDLAYDGEQGLDCALSAIYDMIILDIMMPKMDGLTVLKKLREQHIDTAIILLTARDQIEDKIKGLDCGADDYLAKPFHTDELLARLRALGRRKAEYIHHGILNYGDLELSPQSLILKQGKYEVKLQLKEFQLLEFLMQNPDLTLSKETIIEKVWGYDSNAEDNHAEKLISLLRKKFSKIRTVVSIQTIRGIGYTLRKGKS